MRVVEGADVVVDRRPGLVLGWPRAAVDQLGLQRREEAFRDRVVPAVTDAAHAADDTARRELRPVEFACVLAATVGVVDQAFLRLTNPERHAEGLEGQLGPKVIGDGPSHGPAREDVDDRGEEEPSLPRPHIGHISDPHPIGSIGVEASRDDIRRDREHVLRVGRGTIPTRRPSAAKLPRSATRSSSRPPPVDLAVAPGEVVALVGKNGAGRHALLGRAGRRHDLEPGCGADSFPHACSFATRQVMRAWVYVINYLKYSELIGFILSNADTR
jgi:hypothetical protein